MAIWRGRDIQFLITSSSTATSTSSFSTAVDYAGVFKSVKFKEPETGTGEQPLLGATSGNSNSEVWEEDAGMGEISGDMILQSGTTDLESMFFTYAGTTNKYFNYAGERLNPSIWIRFGDATNYVGFILTGVQFQGGEFSIEAKGSAAHNFKAGVAANNCYKVKGGTYA